MLFNGGKLAGSEPMDRRFMFMEKITRGCLPSLLTSIYPRCQVSVYRTIGPLVFCV